MNQIKLNESTLNKLKHHIYALERENNKTEKLSNTQMVEKIRKLIEREAEDDI
ncbi:MAG: hypothetical protein KMY55_01495 [Dethiosulfatibacter sp.]|nr:hypothetical protein [Dethiosulfatibacter sp.]